MSHSVAKKRYKTVNWTLSNASLQARGLLTIWLDKRMTWLIAASGATHSSKCSDTMVQFLLALHV